MLDQQRLGGVKILGLDHQEGLAIDFVEPGNELFEERRVAVVVNVGVDQAAVWLRGKDAKDESEQQQESDHVGGPLGRAGPPGPAPPVGATSTSSSSATSRRDRPLPTRSEAAG